MPGRLPTSDLAIVQQALTRWNGIYGEAFGAVVVPISWGAHAAAEFGSPPQDILNKQLVDRCDICIALFATRLGTPTAAAESGTAEEIELLGESERYVGILHSRRPVDVSSINLEQARKLDEYLAKIRRNALVLDYASDDELSQRVDTILASAVARDQGRADLQLQQALGQCRQEWRRCGRGLTQPKRQFHSPRAGLLPDVIGISSSAILVMGQPAMSERKSSLLMHTRDCGLS